MPPDRFRLIPEVHLLLQRKSTVLMLRRFQTGYRDGSYSLIAGHLDGNETARDGIVREAREEAGIVVDQSDLVFVHLMHRHEDTERMSLFFTAANWHGEPHNAEPDKCDDMRWIPADGLPVNTVPYIRCALGLIEQGERYSEFGGGFTSPAAADRADGVWSQS